jgi:NADPH:quinone reductase
MKAIKVSSYGDAHVLRLSETEAEPVPAAGQVRVKIHAAGLNFVDIYQRKGLYPPGLPFIPGLEAAGVVDTVGAQVTDFRPGDRVAYAHEAASYSEYATVDAAKLIRLPPALSFEEGAAVPLQGMTAHYLIHEYRVPKQGDTVLVHAAAGGVGRLLVQWAKHLGASVIGTVSTDAKAKVAKEAGADEVIRYTQQDFVAETKRVTRDRGVQIVFDGVAKSTLAGDLEVVAPRGHVVIFGAASGPADPIVPNSLMPKSVSLAGGSLGNYMNSREEVVRRSGDVLEGILAGWLKLLICRVFPLAEAAAAHRLLESRQSVGKVVLKVAE